MDYESVSSTSTDFCLNYGRALIGLNETQVRKAFAAGSLTIPFRIWAPLNDTTGVNIGLTTKHDLPNETIMRWLPKGPLCNITANEYASLELNIELLETTPTAKYAITVEADYHGTVYGGFEIQITVGAVGGTWVPVDKINLMALYVGLTTAILGITIASAAYVKRFKREKE